MQSIHSILAKKASDRSRSPSPTRHPSFCSEGGDHPGERRHPSFLYSEGGDHQGERRNPSFSHSEGGDHQGERRNPSFAHSKGGDHQGERRNPSFAHSEGGDHQGQRRNPSFSHSEGDDRQGESEKEPRDLLRVEDIEADALHECDAGSKEIPERVADTSPIDAQVTICRHSPSPTPSDASVHQVLLRSNRSHTSYGKMDDLAGAVRNYGSITNSMNDNGTEGQTSNGNMNDNSVNSQVLRSSSPRLKRQKSYYTPSMVDELRKRNKLYFLDPITKLLNFHGFPWKLTLQIIKLILITVQVIIFGGQRASIVEYFERSELSYKHLLLNDWDIGFETLPYPPATGQYAIYDISKLFENMNGVMELYYKLPDSSLASLHLNRDKYSGEAYPIELCYRANSFKEFPNGSYIVSASVMHNCTFIHPFGPPENRTYNIEKYLKQHNMTVPFNRTLDITLSFYVRTFHLNLMETHYGPTCYNVSIKIVYTNIERSGQMLVDLHSRPSEIKCVGKIMSPEAQEEQESMKAKVIAFDAVVIAVCCLSTVLCSRSLKRCNNLRKDTAEFFRCHKGKPFSFSNHMEYINMWYILIICNDVMTVIGSAFKIQLETRVFTISSENYEICSILLGLGVLLTYVGILRYLGFFKSYNILILTLKTSFPHVLRFLVCAICLYVGFLFCGWVVFSPYHIKFRRLSTASECLFSLVNGDDMFVTFSALSSKSNPIWYFHRAYLYIFISLFIYVVISVFIAVIMENYENLKRYYVEGFPDTEVQAFIKEDGEMSMKEIFRHVRRDNKWYNWFFCMFPCLACLRSHPRMNSLNQEKRNLLASI